MVNTFLLFSFVLIREIKKLIFFLKKIQLITSNNLLFLSLMGLLEQIIYFYFFNSLIKTNWKNLKKNNKNKFINDKNNPNKYICLIILLLSNLKFYITCFNKQIQQLTTANNISWTHMKSREKTSGNNFPPKSWQKLTNKVNRGRQVILHSTKFVDLPSNVPINVIIPNHIMY